MSKCSTEKEKLKEVKVYITLVVGLFLTTFSVCVSLDFPALQNGHESEYKYGTMQKYLSSV